MHSGIHYSAGWDALLGHLGWPTWFTRCPVSAPVLHLSSVFDECCYTSDRPTCSMHYGSDQRHWTWAAIWVTVLGAEEASQLLEVNGSLFVFTASASHYLQVLLEMSLCLLLIKVRVTTSTFSRACTYAERHKTHRYTYAPVHTHKHARTHTHRHHNPLLLPQRWVEQMLRNLRCKRELGLPPHIHTHTPCAPPLFPPSHALTQFYTLTHTWIYIYYTQNLKMHLSCLYTFTRDMYGWSCVHACIHVHAQKQTRIHTRTRIVAHIPLQAGPAHKGHHVALYSLWHEAPTLPALHCPLPAGEHAPKPWPLSSSVFIPLFLSLSLPSHLFNAHEPRWMSPACFQPPQCAET